MRKITFMVACLFLLMQTTYAQQLNPNQVPRDFVAVEGATGFW